MRRSRVTFWAVFLSGCLQTARAHDVPSFTYDRTIRVSVTEKAIIVHYRIEINEFTLLRDAGEIIEPGVFSNLRTPTQVRDAFLSALAPILADRLEANLDDISIRWQCTGQRWKVEDHLYGDFDFTFALPASDRREWKFHLHLARPSARDSIHLELGKIDLAFDLTTGWILADKIEPSESLKNRPRVDISNREEDQLRTLAASLQKAATTPTVDTPIAPDISAPESIFAQLRRRGPVALLESNLGLGLLLILAAGFGAAHALTPGHGKTLVAAYLVGERGTIGHALLLGVVTTITHTGIVLILAAMLPWLMRHVGAERVQAALGFVGGFLIAGMGLWLLLTRLAGKVDHVHVGGGHHHHHGTGEHHHHLPPPAPDGRIRLWNLIMLGVSGGIVPCWDAIALLAWSIATRQVHLGLPLLLAFSAGLAGVLVLVGILVVKIKGFGNSRFGAGRFVRALPIVSALAVLLLGLWLCLDSVTGK